MLVNIDAINELIKNRFRNNKSYFADEIGVNRAYLSMILNANGKEDSPKVCNGIIKYCKENNLNLKDYIIF